MNFIKAYTDGKEGKNSGLPTGLRTLDRAINRVQRATIYGVAASPKVGKSTLVDFAFVINPYLYAEQHGLDVTFIYYSLEMSRIRLEYKAASYFFYHDYGIATFMHKGKAVTISPNYLLHRQRDDDNELIPVSDEHLGLLKEIYEKRIVPLFGEYDAGGRKISAGKMQVIEDRVNSNPTGISNYLIRYAKNNGTFQTESYQSDDSGFEAQRQRVIGYEPNNPDKYVIVITDHLRKLKMDTGLSLKQNMDKMLEYQVFLRNICGFTFVDVLHLNRSIADAYRIRAAGENIHPDDNDLKDSGNLSEECDFLLTMFNPHDSRYSLSRHMGMDLADYPNYRSLHLVKSRDTECPLHMQINMFAGISFFEPLNSHQRNEHQSSSIRSHR